MKKIIALVLVAILALSLSIAVIAGNPVAGTDAGVVLTPLTEDPNWPVDEPWLYREGIAPFDSLWFGEHVHSLDEFDEDSVPFEDGSDDGRYLGISVEFIRNFCLMVDLSDFYIGTMGVAANRANLGSKLTLVAPAEALVAVGELIPFLDAMVDVELYADTLIPSPQTVLSAYGLTYGENPHGSFTKWGANFTGNLNILAGMQQVGEAQAIKSWTMIWGGSGAVTE